MSELWSTPPLVAITSLCLASFEQLFNRPLVPPGSTEERARALWEAPFFVVSHGTEDDPLFNYANKKALQLWEMSWHEFIRMPSQYSAEPMHRDERAHFLEQVSRDGYIEDYQGIRVSKTGRRFLIEDAIVWNLVDAEGIHRGQAATCSKWTFL